MGLPSPIQIVGVQSYLHGGTNDIPPTVVHMGKSYDFFVFYRLIDVPKGKPAGTMTLQEHAGPPQSAHVFVAEDFYGIKQMGVNLAFSQKLHDTLVPAVVTFTITDGKLHASELLKFMVVR